MLKNVFQNDLILKDEVIPKSFLKRKFRFLQDSFVDFVESSFFTQAVMIAIILNTFTMAIEHHNQVRILTAGSSVSSVASVGWSRRFVAKFV